MKIHSYNKTLREGQYNLQKETNERKEDSDGDNDMTEAWTSLGMSISNDDNDNDYVEDNECDDETVRNNF